MLIDGEDDEKDKVIINDDDDDDDFIDVEVIDDVPEEDKGKPVAAEDSTDEELSDDELKSYSARVQDRINKLTAKANSERRAKEAVVRERDEALTAAKAIADESNRLKQTLTSGEHVWKDTNKGRLEAEITSANREFREAYDSGDGEKLAAAQGKLTRLQVELERTNSWTPRPIEPTKVPVAAPRADPKASDWQARNNWFGQDVALTGLALGVHEDLVRNQGVDPTSDEYYSRLDGELKRRFPEKFTKGAATGQVAPPRSSVVAPAGRVQNGKTPRKVSLTKTQEVIARRLGLTKEQYASEVLKLRTNND